MFTTLIVFQVLVAMGLIAIVLVQRGPGATMGAAFGAGASGTVFGSRGAGNFLTRTTSWLAVGFFGISLSLAILATGLSGGGSDPDSALSGSVIDQQEQEQADGDAGAAIDSALESLDSQPAGDEAASDAPVEAQDAPAEQQATDSETAAPSSTTEPDAEPEPPAGP